VWRNLCIEEAGGWQSDTLTEDLDLSYRAQLKGWKFKYMERIGAPAELPAAMNALKNQQYRWTKGAAVPMLLIKFNNPELGMVFKLASIFLLSFVILSYFYWTSASHGSMSSRKSFGEFLMLFPLFLSVSMGLSLHNAIAVIEGYVGRKTPFVRTPKFDIQTQEDGFVKNRYRITKIHPVTVLESLLALYFAGGIGMAFYLKDFGLIPFHIMLCLGFGIVSYYSIRHARM